MCLLDVCLSILSRWCVEFLTHERKGSKPKGIGRFFSRYRHTSVELWRHSVVSPDLLFSVHWLKLETKFLFPFLLLFLSRFLFHYCSCYALTSFPVLSPGVTFLTTMSHALLWFSPLNASCSMSLLVSCSSLQVRQRFGSWHICHRHLSKLLGGWSLVFVIMTVIMLQYTFCQILLRWSNTRRWFKHVACMASLELHTKS